MDDLDELKGRVERATRVLTEREAEENGRHAKLMSLVAALEARTLEAREEKTRAEARLAAAENENAELRGLLDHLLDAVESGSRSRFADAIYALEARVSGQPAEATAEADEPVARDLGPAGTDAAEVAPLPADDFTERLAAHCGIEEELDREAEALKAEAQDDAMALLARIRRQIEAPEAAGEPPLPQQDEPVAEPEVPEMQAPEADAAETYAAEMDVAEIGDGAIDDGEIGAAGREAAQPAAEEPTPTPDDDEVPLAETEAEAIEAQQSAEDEAEDADEAEAEWPARRQASS